jgi:hypothetical protein
MKLNHLFTILIFSMIFNSCKITEDLISLLLLENYNKQINEKMNTVYKNIDEINKLLDLNEYKIEELEKRLYEVEEKNENEN